MKRITNIRRDRGTVLKAISISFCMSLFVTHTEARQHTPYTFAEQDTTAYFVDVTSFHLPQDPELHALDAVFTDVDHDGDPDILIGVEYGENRLYLNDGNGRFTWKKGAFGPSAHDTEHVLSADFNVDGHPDVIFVAEDDQTHQLFLGGPEGEFTEVSERLPGKSEGNALAIGDVNGDGLIDIVIGNSGGQRSDATGHAPAQDFLWLNDPERPGYFIDVVATHMPADNDDTQDIALVDLNGDGHLDMVIANENQSNRLLLNNGSGHFTDASERLELLVPMETRQVHVLDANGDGKPDLLFLNLTSNNSGWDKDPRARLLINDGNGFFKDQTEERLPENRFSTYAGTIVDFNDDGHPDILMGALQIPGFNPLQLRAYQNDGNGYFKDVTPEVVPGVTVGRHWGMAVGDLNGDGKDDIFIGAWGTQARLLLGQ
ncbi:VCBS repeat-containing protein [uncultured Proteiniphilum sp.]|uniref:FG-GAP repeat domain-containing protein n=1 Tax=uncultured Proteiniphilum sp. TaxID=497637 RepID=UPI0026335F32|nr:VCBS repeat-containing protein [uncultured Proteiniphilum sp.]